MALMKEFKEFAMRGSVVDLAIGVIIGGAFGRIVSSFVQDVIMPPIGLLLGGVDFKGLFLNLGSTPYATLAEAKAADAPTLNYGLFLQALVDFIIVAFVIFMVVKGINTMRRKEAEKPAPPPGPTAEERLLTEIRDTLRARA
jgi:large conductance mechanosensitive channel